VHQLSEDGRNSVRQVRRDANDRLKKMLKDHGLSQDDEKKGLEEVQKADRPEHQGDRRSAEEEGLGASGTLAPESLKSDSSTSYLVLLTSQF